jgi:hypothetical protein
MKINEGRVDRFLRIFVGLALISLVFLGPKAAWGYIGLVPLLTGIFGICPLYSIFGLNTCTTSQKHK